MNMLQRIENKRAAGRGLSRVMILIVAASALLMFAGSAQAQSAGRSFDRSVSIQTNAGRFSLQNLGEAVRAGRGVLERISEQATREGRGPRISIPSPWRPIRPIVIRPIRPEPVTAVPEPGAALLFGAGIVLAGLRRRS